MATIVTKTTSKHDSNVPPRRTTSTTRTSHPIRRTFKLTKCLIEYKRVGESDYEPQKNCYGSYVATEPRLAAKKAFKEIASSYEIKQSIDSGTPYVLDRPILFGMIEVTRGINKMKLFLGERVHLAKPIHKTIGTKKIIVRFEDQVYTVKPTLRIPSNTLRMVDDTELVKPRNQKTASKIMTDERLTSMMADIKHFNSDISNRMNSII